MNEELARRFPEMKPINGSPTLFTLNGCGLSMYGRRNFDAETGTYIATRFLTLVFVPVFAVGSYRVADAEEGGWYFLGKEGVSKVWQTLNMAVLSVLIYAIGMIFWSSHTSSPDYRQKQALELVEKHEAGKVMDSMVALVEVHGIGGSKDTEVAENLRDLAVEGITAGSWKEAGQVLRFASSNRHVFKTVDGFADDLSAAGEERLGKVTTSDHVEAHQLSGQFIGLMTSMKHESVAQFQKLDRGFLETLAVDPKADIKYAVSLAEYCEKDGDGKRCKELLQPRIKDLGDTEGARILGQILVGEGDHEAAYPLLAGYVLPKLEKLKKASTRFDKASDDSYNRAIKYLNDGKAPETFYNRYDKASKEEQSQMVNEIVVRRMDKDSSYTSALKSLREAGGVVPVAMDFGVMQLRRAQGLSDQAAKKKLLQSAEKTFLALQTVAGDDEDYQLSLGQVYFWMGRMDEGEKLFETARKSSGESAGMLYDQGSIYRELGDETKAMELLKKAHGKAKNKEDGYAIARTIATICDEAEDEIEWLKKCDQKEVSVKIGISNAEGKLAYGNGEYAKALKHFEKAHKDYKQMQENATTFNNHSLVLQYLYAITGKPAYYQQSVEMMDEAVKLMPNNAILLSNAASQAFTSATIEMVSKKFSPEFVKEMSDRSSLRLLYNNEGERAAMRSDFLAQDSAKRAFKYLGALQVLSPKSEWVHSTGAAWYWAMGIEKELVASSKLATSIDWDLDADWKANQDEVIAGKQNHEFSDAIARSKKYDARVRKSITNDDEWLLYQSSRIEQKITAQAYGVEVDYSALLQLTQKALAKYPSSYTRGVHREVLLAKGLHDLSQSQSEVKKLMVSHSRLLDNSGIMIVLLHRGDEALKKAIVSNPAIKAYLQARYQSVIYFPQSVSLTDRYFCSLLGSGLKLSPPADSAAFVSLSKQDAKSSLARYPRSVSTIMHSYWILSLSGKENEAKALYDSALKKGVALPPLS